MKKPKRQYTRAELCEQVQDYMRRMGFSRDWMAIVAGCHPDTVSHVLSGRYPPTAGMLELLGYKRKAQRVTTVSYEKA